LAYYGPLSICYQRLASVPGRYGNVGGGLAFYGLCFIVSNGQPVFVVVIPTLAEYGHITGSNRYATQSEMYNGRDTVPVLANTGTLVAASVRLVLAYIWDDNALPVLIGTVLPLLVGTVLSVLVGTVLPILATSVRTVLACLG